MLKLENVTKRFGKMVAVKRLSLRVKRGEVFAFLGPNGAGKTTTIKMIVGLMRPEHGRISLAGLSVAGGGAAYRRLFGYIPDGPYLPGKLKVDEFIRFSGATYGLGGGELEEKAVAALAEFGLLEQRGEMVENLSHGMRQRLLFAAQLLHHPSLLVVDEPMVGLDPESALRVRRLFRRMADEGRSVFMSTHNLEVAEKVSDRIAIIDKGKVLAMGSCRQLLKRGKDLEQVFLRLTGGS